MKKLFIILAFLFVSVGLMAQDKVISGYGVSGFTLPYSTTAQKLAIRHTAAWNYVFQLNVSSPYQYAYTINTLDLGGAPANNTSTAYFQGSVDGVNYTNIDTISYGGSSTGEAKTNSITSSPLSWKYLRFNVTPSDTIWVCSVNINILPVSK
jgi:hypothetical protein